MVIASKRHSAEQVPQPEHFASITWALTLVLLSARIAEYGQTLAHRPQPVQTSGSTQAVIASTFNFSEFKTICARAAAALAWVTLSLISFGPSAQPAR